MRGLHRPAFWGRSMNVGPNETPVVLTRGRIGLAALCITFGTWLPLNAAEPTFDDLLSKARAQAAAGRQFAPAGDNVVETVLSLYKLSAVATPLQLNALSSLLNNEDLIQPGRHIDRAKKSADTLPAFGGSRSGVVPQDPDLIRAEAPIGPALSDARPGTTMPDQRAASLFAKGENAEGRGDISAARRFFAGAAQLGHAAAALQVGRLYDPAFVVQATIGGIDTDPVAAEHWYERAAELGDPRATQLLHALSAR